MKVYLVIRIQHDYLYDASFKNVLSVYETESKAVMGITDFKNQDKLKKWDYVDIEYEIMEFDVL